MDNPKPDKQCAHCGNIGELTKCSRCKDIYYCGSGCQKVGWLEHQHLCAEDAIEKAVLRAGWLLKKLFLASRQRASGEVIHDWQWNAEHTCLSIIRSTLLGSFKKFSLKVAVTEEEREMIWTALYCKAAVGFFSNLLKILLQGNSTTKMRIQMDSNVYKEVPIVLREVNLSLQPPKRSARIQELKGNGEWIESHKVHCVYLVSSTKDSTKKWFIDPTGAQFGIRAPVHKVNVYMKKWGKAVLTIAPSGIAKAQLIELGTGEGLKEICLGIMFRQEQGVATAIEAAVQTWKKQTGLPFSKLLVGSDSRYKELEPVALNAIDEYVARYDKTAEMAKVPPLGGKTVNLMNTHMMEKQERDILKYRFNGTWD
jgi:hypothetical protein